MVKWYIVICHITKRSWVQTLLFTFSKTICWWTVHIPYGFHVESIWNPCGIIPCGMCMDSIWNP